ncbi:MAG: DNA adenine methylase [Bacteroidales bacterium]|nr:DNA adenine methylase [Bacteroidales bacterium]
MHTYTHVDNFYSPSGICTGIKAEGVTRVAIEPAKGCCEEIFSTKIKEAKPFVKWAGGKRQLIPTIDEFVAVANGKVAIDTYVEPFVGGGAVLFWILSNYDQIKRVVINDINVDLMTAYQVVRDAPEDLIEALAKLQSKYYSIKVDERMVFFNQVRDAYNKKELDSVENTSYFIFLNRTCFNGLYRVNRKGLYNVPFGKYVSPRICDETNIYACSRLLQKVEILCGDYSQTIGYANQHSLYYFDPPYKPLSMTSNFTAYSTTAYNDEEQIRLSAFCQKIDEAGSLFLLSNSDVSQVDHGNCFFDDLYRDFNIHRVRARRMINSVASKRGDVSELLICNFH